MVDLSVVIPVFNPPKSSFLKCLDSIYYQSFTNFEVIIVNDGSDDRFDSLIANSIGKFSNKAYVKVSNGGQGKARNIGAGLAKGKYILFCDQDDYYDYRFFHFALHYSEAHSLEICIFDYFVEDGQSSTLISLLGLHTFEKEVCLGISDIQVWNKVFRREFLVDTGLHFPEHRICCEDLVVFPQWIVAATRVGYVPAAFYHHLVGGNQQSSSLGKLQRSRDVLLGCKLLAESDSFSGKYSEYLQSQIAIHTEEFTLKDRELEFENVKEVGAWLPFLFSFNRENIFFRMQRDRGFARDHVISRDAMYKAQETAITIITTTKNSAKTLRQTMDSVIRQGINDFEYLVVDGNSTDDTISIVESLRRRNNRIQLVEGKESGIYDAMNAGIELAQGEIVAILNSDDWYCSGALKRVIEVFAANPSVDVVYGAVNAVSEDREFRFKAEGQCDNLDTYMLPHPGVFVRRRVYKIAGLFDVSIPRVADYDFLCRVYVGGFKFARVDQVLANFRLSGESSIVPEATKNEADEVRVKHFGYKHICELQTQLFWRLHEMMAVGRT